VTEMFVD